MKKARVRVSDRVWRQLEKNLWSGYPDREAASFFECGWAGTGDTLAITVREIFEPRPGDVRSDGAEVSIDEAYSLRAALAVEKGPYAIGLIHSHPKGYGTSPSGIDDDMDSYFANYFSGFTKGRPYISLIVSQDDSGRLNFSGRVFIDGSWIQCDRIQIVGSKVTFADSHFGSFNDVPDLVSRRLERMTGIMGREAAGRLWRSRIVIFGAGGTGSPLVHSLTRSCVGEIIVIDPQRLSISNSERIHGVIPSDFEQEELPFKVDVAKRLASMTNPDIKVVALPEDALSPAALEYVLGADFIVGCGDSQTIKVLTSDLASRLLIPVINVNVAMESGSTGVTGEIIHITRYGPDLPCAYCRSEVDSVLLSQEQMSPEERAQRQDAAAAATDEAERNMYWKNEPVIHTTGSLTGVAAELVANYAIGLLTGVYAMPSDFIELDLLNPQGCTTVPMKRRNGCMCDGHDGGAGQQSGWLGNE